MEGSSGSVVVPGLRDEIFGEPPGHLPGARVLAILGEPGELVREPTSRATQSTAVTWAGIADLAIDAALEFSRPSPRAASRTRSSPRLRQNITAQATSVRWLEHAARQADEDPRSRSRASRRLCARPSPDVAGRSGRGRARLRLSPLRGRLPLDRSRRDLELFSCNTASSLHWPRRSQAVTERRAAREGTPRPRILR